MIDGDMYYKGQGGTVWSLAVFHWSRVPSCLPHAVMKRDVDENMKKLTDEWLRAQTKKQQAKKESVKKTMKSRMDLILKVIQKLQSCRGTLVRTNEQLGNSVERQRAKEEMESRLPDLEELANYFSRF